MIKIAYQFMIRNKRTSMSILFSIILSVALLGGIGALLHSADISKSEYYKTISGNYQYVYDITDSQLDLVQNKLKTHKINISDLGITRNLYFTDEPKILTVVGTNSEYLQMNHMSLISGKLPVNKNQIVVENWTIHNLNLKNGIGDTLSIEGKDFEIVGIVSDSFEKYDKNMNVYTVLSDTDSTNNTYKLYVNFDTSRNIEKQSIEYMKYLGSTQEDRGANWDVLEPLGVKAPKSDENWSIISWLQNVSMDENMVTFLFGIFSAFIVYSILNITVMQRMPQYGLLEILGASGWRIFRVIFYEICFLYLIGYPIGCIVGIAGAKILNDNFSHIFLNTYISQVPFVISYKVIVNGFFFLLILLLLITIKVVLQLKNKVNIDVLRDKNIYLLKSRKILSLEHKSLLYSLSHRYMTLRPKVFIGILISLSIGGIIFLGSGYAVNETKHQNNLVMKADDGLNSDYVISMENSDFNEGISEENLKEIEAVVGVKEVCPVKHFMGATLISESQYTNKHFFDDANKMERIKEYFNGICTKEKDGNYLIKGNLYGYGNVMIQKLSDYLIDGSLDINRMDEKGEVIVCLPQDGGTGKYDTIKIQPGDIIRIKVPKSINVSEDVLKFQGESDWYEIKEFKVAATVKRVMAHNDYFIGPYGLDIIMSNSMMEKEFLIDKYNIISIEKEKGADGTLVADKIQEITNNIERCTFIDYTSLVEKENMNLNQRQIFFTGLSAVIALISMFHIINSINYLIISRKQDFGILRAIGLSDRSFIQMMMREGLLYGVYASALMIIGTVIVNTIIFYFIKNIGLYLSPRYTVNWIYLLLYIVINCGLSMMAVLISVRNILKKEIIDCVNKIG